MSGLSDAQAAIAAQNAAIANLTANVNLIITDLQAAAGDPDASVESLSQAITNNTAALTAANSAIQGVITPAPAAAPAPGAPGT